MAQQSSSAILLAWADWKYESLLSLCAVLALASMLSPILVLQGLKNGVTNGMRERLLKDPATLLIIPKSDAGRFSQRDLAELGKLPGANYIIGRTRETATDLTLRHDNLHASIALEPSSPGEPLLALYQLSAPEAGHTPQIVLSAPAASALKAQVGTKLTANLSRRNTDGKLETVPIEFLVTGILPIAAADRKIGFVALELLEDMENYRDNIDVPKRAWSGSYPPRTRSYASFRLYASSLDDVPELARLLGARDIEVITKSRDIAAIKSLETAINEIILIISLAIGCGFVAFMLSSAEGAARRKKKMLGMLRLLGFRRFPIMLYPLAQSFLTTISGFCLSLLLYWGVAEAIRHVFADKGNLQCQLSALECLITFGLILFLSWCASFHAAWHTSSLEPSMVIREV